MVMLIGYSKTGFSKNVAHFGQSGIYFISSFFWGGRYTERSPGSSMYRRRHARRHRIHDPSWGRERDAPSFARVRSQRGSPRIVVPPHSDRSPLGMFSHQITSHARFQVYILDDYGNAHDPVVYVWVGKDAADTDARIALTNKEVFLKEKRASQGSQLSLSVTVVRIRQSLEMPWFHLDYQGKPEHDHLK